MLNLSNENMDNDLSHLVDSKVEHHQVVEIGSVDDFGGHSLQEPQMPQAFAQTGTLAATSESENLDDWY